MDTYLVGKRSPLNDKINITKVETEKFRIKKTEVIEPINKKPVKACTNCVWRNYKYSTNVGCDHPIILYSIGRDYKLVTPCEFWEYDDTGTKYKERQLLKEKYNVEFVG